MTDHSTDSNSTENPQGTAPMEPTEPTNANPAHPKWRSKVVPKKLEDMNPMPSMGYFVGKEVRVLGPRGRSPVYKIYQVLGGGRYKLKDGQTVLPDTYAEENLVRA